MNTEPTKFENDPYVTCRTCSTYTRIWKANRKELQKSPRPESIDECNTGIIVSVPCGSSIEELSRPCQTACSSYSLRHHVA